ncbi:DedA family protein [Rhodoluna lacicola]|uniref:Putative membrane-associated protein n=1 Tax=Rhodoluna lacicola TaxID=529884 RepID=A0A060JF83_9MICO|nr:DedA family protein [Rhodoluna lacicola]AIC47415.1 putative membrane-associated protein [Rhodoluna lacicola]
MNELLNWLLTTVQSVDPLTRNLLAGLAIMLETSLFVGLVMPGDTVVLVAATGVANLLDFFFLLGAVLLGSLIGESLGFWIGRLFGEKIRYSKLGNKIGEKNWKMADAFIESRGGLAVAISRFLPVLHSLVPVVAGASTMRYRIFIRWTVAACAIWASAYVGVGYIAQASYEQIGANLKFGAVIFIAIILTFAIIVHFAKKRLEKAAIKMVETDKAAQFTGLEG